MPRTSGAVDRKVTVVLAAPVPVSASFVVMLSLADEPVSDARLSVTVGPMVLSVKVDRATGADVAGGVGVLGHDAVAAIARQRDAGAPAAVALHERGADAVVLPLSNSVTVVPASPVPVIVWAA